MKSQRKEEEIMEKNLIRKAHAAANLLTEEQILRVMNLWENTSFPTWYSGLPEEFDKYMKQLKNILPNHTDKDYEIYTLMFNLIMSLKEKTIDEICQSFWNYINEDYAFDHYVHKSGVSSSYYDVFIENAIKYVNTNFKHYMKLLSEIESTQVKERLHNRFDERLQKKEKHPVNLRPSRLYGEETRAPRKKTTYKKPAIRVNIRKMF